MSLSVKKVDYFNIIVNKHAKEGSDLLFVFAKVGISLLAYKAVQKESGLTTFSLIPNDKQKMIEGAKKAGLEMEGPFSALLIQGDDESGALAEIYEKLAMADVKISESSGIADINGAYGVILYLNEADCDKAIAALR